MNNAKFNQSQLTDAAYIQWAQEKKWSWTEAVHLLHGCVPPESELAIDQLIKEFPNAEGLLQHYPKLLKKKDKKKEFNQEEDPDTWVFLAAMLYDMNVSICWDAIFPQWIKGNGGYDFGESPDYRRFVQVFVSDTEISLGKLAEYVLDLGKNAMTDPPAEFYNILEDMNAALGINTKESGKLPGMMVSPRKFIEKCPREYFHFKSGSQCSRWINWPAEYPKLANWLEISSEVKKDPTQERTAKYRFGFIRTLMFNYFDQASGRKDFNSCRRFMLNHPDCSEGENGSICYVTYEGIPKEIKRKTLTNQYRDNEKLHKELSTRPT